MAEEAKALDAILSEMRDELDLATSETQRESYETLWKKDKERFEASSKKEQFPRKIKKGDFSRINKKHGEYIGLIYLRHHSKVCQAEAEVNDLPAVVRRYEEAETEFTDDLLDYEDSISEADDMLDLEAARMFANSTKKTMSYENRAFQLLIGGTDYGLLSSLAKGLGKRYTQARVNKTAKRFELIGKYFDMDCSVFSQDLTAEQAGDLKDILNAGLYDEHAAEAVDLVADVNAYIAATQTTLAMRTDDSMEILAKVFNEQYAQNNPEMADNLQQMMTVLKKFEHVEHAEISPEHMQFALINYLHATMKNAGISSMDIPTEGKDMVTLRASGRKEIRRAAREELPRYGFNDNEHNYELIDNAILKLMNGNVMRDE